MNPSRNADGGAASTEPNDREPAKPGRFDFLESMPYAQIAFTVDLIILAVNSRHTAMTGVAPADMIGRPVFEVFPPKPGEPDASAEKPLRDSVARVERTGEPDTMPVVKHDIEDPDAPGQYVERYWQLVHSPLRDHEGRMVGILQTSRDITRETTTRRIEDARRRSAEAGGKIQFWGLDLSTGEMSRSPGTDSLFGFSPDEPGTLETLVARIHEEDRPALLQDLEDAQTLPAGTAFDSEYRILRADGSLRYVNSLMEVAMQDGSRRLAGVLIDTTAIHRREESLRRLVEEKQILLADVNHRVKNSLQLVSSLLSIEQRATGNSDVAERLGITAGRVAAITAIHASLYHYAEMSRVNISEHLRTFCAQLGDEYGGHIHLELDDEPLYLSAERAVPLALVVNELAARALQGRTGASITVSMKDDAGRLLLRIENAVRSSQTSSGTLGSRLVEALLLQLDATLKQDVSDDGTACIEFERT